MDKKNSKNRINAVRQYAQELLKWCDQAEDGTLEFGEFEKRLTKTSASVVHHGSVWNKDLPQPPSFP